MDTLKSKLPIKRKIQEFPTTTPATVFNSDPRPPPFKFHRIWTEPDEIRFLEGLLNCRSDKLSFPRDLNVFYARFSNSMSQPYTRSQLSEKLRRLRKKFRVISTRLSKGLDFVLLSPHDRALYGLAKQLWHPEFASTSPFLASNCVASIGGSGSYNFGNYSRNGNDAGLVKNNGNSMVVDNVGGNDVGSCEKSGLVGVEVKFLPNFEMKCEDIEYGEEYDGIEDTLVFDGVDVDDGVEVKLSEVDVKFEDCVDIGDDGFLDNQVVGDSVDFSDCNGDADGDGFADFGGGEIRGEEEKVVQNGDPNAGGHGMKVEEEMVGCGLRVNEVGGRTAKIVMNVFNDALEDVRKDFVYDDLIKDEEQRFEKQWHEQRVAELDVFAQRMRLIIENSIIKNMSK